MRKIFIILLILAFLLTNTLTTNALNKSEEKDSVILISTVNDIDTYEVTEHNHKFTFTVDPINMFVVVNKNVYTFESYFNALEIQTDTNVSLDFAIASMDTIKPYEVLQKQLNHSVLAYSTQATNPPTSGYNAYGPYFYLWYYDVALVIQQTCFAFIASIFGITVTQGELHVKSVMQAALSAGMIANLNVIFNTATYKKIRQAFHPTVMYAVKQESQFCTWDGTTYRTTGNISTTFFWTQQPY